MKISRSKQDTISRQALNFLEGVYPQSKFTSHIARAIARDEEFILEQLRYLESKRLIKKITTNKNGIKYARRKEWVFIERGK